MSVAKGRCTLRKSQGNVWPDWNSTPRWNKRTAKTIARTPAQPGDELCLGWLTVLMLGGLGFLSYLSATPFGSLR